MDAGPPIRARIRAWTRWQGWWIVAAFLLAASPVRELARSLARGRAPGTPIDEAFGPLVRALPTAGRVGWIADVEKRQRAMEARVALQYAAAPRVVTDETNGLPSVVAWAPDATSLDRLLLTRGLRVVGRFAAGYALCAPKQGP